MRKRSDNWVNATHILIVANFDKAARTKILEREVQRGLHEKVQGGYGKFQGRYLHSLFVVFSMLSGQRQSGRRQLLLLVIADDVVHLRHSILHCSSVPAYYPYLRSLTFTLYLDAISHCPTHTPD